MKVSQSQPQNFNGGAFYRAGAEVEKNAILNRAIVDLGGVMPWLFKTNNKEEKRERAINLLTFFGFAFLAPLVTVPAANRIIMKHCKLTKGVWSNNHKAVQISNEFLKNKELTEKGINELAKNVSTSPLESVYRFINGKAKNDKLDVNELLKNCNNDWEKVRKRLINAKNAVLCSDLLITGFTLGGLGFLNNYITEKKTGKTGFSAELKMADPKLIEERAKNYTKTKRKRMALFAAEVLAISGAIPFALKKGLTSNGTSKFSQFMQKHAKLFDYNKGIYMSRLALFVGIIMNWSGLEISARNKTEAKDWAIRNSITVPVFFGGDLLLGSVFANLSDRIFKTRLTEKSEKQNLFRKIFPKTKSLEEINRLAHAGKMTLKEKRLAHGIYWGNMALVSAALAFTVPYLCNKMIKSDVQKEVDKNKQNEKIKPDNNSIIQIKTFKEFIY